MHVGEEVIAWSHWTEAYKYDQAKKSPFFAKLTPEHMQPDQLDKLHNHLAVDVLGPRMLQLMQVRAEICVQAVQNVWKFLWILKVCKTDQGNESRFFIIYPSGKRRLDHA